MSQPRATTALELYDEVQRLVPLPRHEVRYLGATEVDRDPAKVEEQMVGWRLVMEARRSRKEGSAAIFTLSTLQRELAVQAQNELVRKRMENRHFKELDRVIVSPPLLRPIIRAKYDLGTLINDFNATHEQFKNDMTARSAGWRGLGVSPRESNLWKFH